MIATAMLSMLAGIGWPVIGDRPDTQEARRPPPPRSERPIEPERSWSRPSDCARKRRGNPCVPHPIDPLAGHYGAIPAQ